MDRLVLDSKLEPEPCELRPLGQLVHDGAHDGRRLGVAERNDLAALLELAEEQHVVDELRHLDHLVLRLAEEPLQVGAGELGRLEQREQPGERRAQLVRDRRCEGGAEPSYSGSPLG